MAQTPVFPVHQTTLRVTPEMLDELKLQASERNRTINSWLVDVLTSSLQIHEVLPFPPSPALPLVVSVPFVYRIPVETHRQLVVAAEARGTRASIEARDRISLMFGIEEAQNIAWGRLKAAVNDVAGSECAGQAGQGVGGATEQKVHLSSVAAPQTLATSG